MNVESTDEFRLYDSDAIWMAAAVISFVFVLLGVGRLFLWFLSRKGDVTTGEPGRHATKCLWFGIAFSLGIVFTIVVAIRVGFAVPVKQGDLQWFFITIPFAIGLAFGAMIPKQGYGNPAVLWSIFVCPLVMAAGVGILGIVHGSMDPNPTLEVPLWFKPLWVVVQGLSAGAMILPGGIVFGAPPALVGAAIAHCLKLAQSAPVKLGSN